jgi:hypothetical protein
VIASQTPPFRIAIRRGIADPYGTFVTFGGFALESAILLA